MDLDKIREGMEVQQAVFLNDQDHAQLRTSGHRFTEFCEKEMLIVIVRIRKREYRRVRKVYLSTKLLEMHGHRIIIRRFDPDVEALCSSSFVC